MSVLNVDFKDREGNWVLRYREPLHIGGKFVQTRLGRLHNNVTQRANTDGKLQNKHIPAYKGVTLADEFKDAQKFCDWAVNQAGWGVDYHLDKDLLCKGNMVYGPEYCVFLPKELNFAIRPSDNRNGLPAGVFKGRQVGKYFSAIGKAGVNVYLGIFNTIEEAANAYKTAKESYVKELANKYKDTIDQRAYAALMSWTVD